MLAWRPLRFVGLSAIFFLFTGCGSGALGQAHSQQTTANTTTPAASISPSAVSTASPATSASPSYSGSYPSAEQAGIAGTETKTGLTYTAGACPSGQSCLSGARVFGNADPNLGLDAAYVQMAGGGSGGGAICDAYVYYDSAGWHVFPPVACVQQSGYNPVLGTEDHVQVPGGGCANVRQSPTLGAKVLTCLRDGTLVTVDTIFPRYADGHIWWSINHQQGFMAYDYLIGQV
jgi:hypothetical protein